MSMREIDIGPLTLTPRRLCDLLDRCVIKRIITAESAEEIRKAEFPQ